MQKVLNGSAGKFPEFRCTTHPWCPLLAFSYILNALNEMTLHFLVCTLLLIFPPGKLSMVWSTRLLFEIIILPSLNFLNFYLNWAWEFLKISSFTEINWLRWATLSFFAFAYSNLNSVFNTLDVIMVFWQQKYLALAILSFAIFLRFWPLEHHLRCSMTASCQTTSFEQTT